MKWQKLGLKKMLGLKQEEIRIRTRQILGQGTRNYENMVRKWELEKK